MIKQKSVKQKVKNKKHKKYFTFSKHKNTFSLSLSLLSSYSSNLSKLRNYLKIIFFLKVKLKSQNGV